MPSGMTIIPIECAFYAHSIGTYSYSVRLLRCSFTQMGTCQSLRKRNEQPIKALTLFYALSYIKIIHIILIILRVNS